MSRLGQLSPRLLHHELPTVKRDGNPHLAWRVRLHVRIVLAHLSMDRPLGDVVAAFQHSLAGRSKSGRSSAVFCQSMMSLDGQLRSLPAACSFRRSKALTCKAAASHVCGRRSASRTSSWMLWSGFFHRGQWQSAWRLESATNTLSLKHETPCHLLRPYTTKVFHLTNICRLPVLRLYSEEHSGSCCEPNRSDCCASYKNHFFPEAIPG